jgi:hypothetical protein
MLCINYHMYSGPVQLYVWPIRFNGSLLLNRRFNRFATVEPLNHRTKGLIGSITGPVLITMAAVRHRRDG